MTDSPAPQEMEYGVESPQPGLWYVTTNPLLAETMRAGRPDAPWFQRPATPWKESVE